MSRKKPVINTYTGVLAELETEIAGLPVSLAELPEVDRLRAVSKFQRRAVHLHSRMERRLWHLGCQLRRAVDKEIAAEFSRRARKETDPAEKAKLRQMAYEVRHPQSELSA
jgi:hypothetical protein